MKLSKILKLSLNMLVHSKLRSWLTILGIFIGVAAVVAIISLGQGLQQSVNSQIQGLGQDIITISSGSSRAVFGGGEGFGRSSATTNIKQLSTNDIQALKLVPNIKYINGIINGRTEIKYLSETTSSTVQGYDPSVFKEFVTTALASGRYLEQGDARAIVIGDNIANSVYKSRLGVGYTLEINKVPFRVVGILSPSSGFGGSDNSIYMSTKDARDVLNGIITLKQNEYSSLVIKVANQNLVQETSDKITTVMQNSHHTASGKEDFSVNSALALQQRLSTVTGGITLFLGIIAAVSLLVGGIGVANTMFTSVLEKTRDIGVMKAIGAKNSDILLIFLFNSGLLGLVGGILGLIVGVAISSALPYLGAGVGFGPGSRGGIQTSISASLLIFTLAFSLIIGMISGLIPAWKASKLKPVEALRYE